MTRLTTSKARGAFSRTLSRVEKRGDRIVLHRRGKDIAALVPVEDLKLLEEIEDQLDIAEADQSLAEALAKGTIPWEKIRERFGL
jgi:prevent-host-death family protein